MTERILQLPRTLTILYLLVGLGALLQIGGGHWDVTWHALQKPETFFTPPHSIVYAGVMLSLSTAIVGLTLGSRRKFEKRFTKFLKYAVIGCSLEIFSGGFDLWWHSNFGFDGLLSPPHAVLVSGMILISLAASLGLAKISLARERKENESLLKLGSVISFTALWMSSVGMVMLFTLPFSEGEYYDFNPDPNFAAALATVTLPALGPLIIILARRTLPLAYPATTLMGSYMIINATTTILAHPGIAPTLPYYLMNIILAFAVDYILRRKIEERVKALMTGAIIGPFFYTLYFPLVTHAFRESLGISVEVFVTTISLFQSTYQIVTTATFLPAIFVGSMGAIMALVISRKMTNSVKIDVIKE